VCVFLLVLSLCVQIRESFKRKIIFFIRSKSEIFFLNKVEVPSLIKKMIPKLEFGDTTGPYLEHTQENLTISSQTMFRILAEVSLARTWATLLESLPT
jgi:hypothetical protein